jgi:hypothetical protein
VWLFSHDEGACWAPTDIAANSIVLTHWGRMDLEHTSNTAYSSDNYTFDWSHPQLQPDGWTKYIKVRLLALASSRWRRSPQSARLHQVTRLQGARGASGVNWHSHNTAGPTQWT